jgi:hypothetical protein
MGVLERPLRGDRRINHEPFRFNIGFTKEGCMRLLPVFLLVFSLAFATAGRSADKSVFDSGYMSNGRYWAALSPGSKALYISAFREGVEALALTECKTYECFKTKGTAILPLGVINGELIECLNQEFSEPTMRIVPIYQVLRLVCKARFEGDDPAAIEEARNRLKKQWSNPATP